MNEKSAKPARVSYEQHRAVKAGMRRRNSLAESETDAESLASFTTHQSSSSYGYHGGFPFQRLGSSSGMDNLGSSSSAFGLGLTSHGSPGQAMRQRTLSSYSRDGTESLSGGQGSPVLSQGTATRDAGLQPHLRPPHRLSASGSSSQTSSPISELERERRRARREAKRREREKRSTLVGEKYDSPLRRWLRWMSAQDISGPYSLAMGCVATGMVKTAIGFGGFSGSDRTDSPIFGDFEAQRHWMELTIHVPIRQWYRYGPDWWNLDYPPLTAYISWLCGKIGSLLDPANFALDTSRGLSTPDLVTYMRATVLVLEAAVWWSAVIVWVMQEGEKGGRSWRTRVTGIVTVLLQPSLALIDNGHFQYNSVLLGLTLWAVIFASRGQDIRACVAFSAALCFKHMGLYYAPAMGCYLLGKCYYLGEANGITHLVKLGIVTLSTFSLMFLPWLSSADDILQVLHRLFPFARGVFEDKVANFWCASNVAIKWRKLFGIPTMAKLATLLTLVALLPTVIILLNSAIATRPSPPQPATLKEPFRESSMLPRRRIQAPIFALLPIALFTSSLSFFLFSFQVHEKGILLPLMPLTLLMSMRGGRDGSSAGRSEDEIFEWGVLVNNVAVFSMWPLLVRDGQALQYFTLTALWNFLIGYNPLKLEGGWTRLLSLEVYAVIGAIHIGEQLPIPAFHPARYPDIYVVLNVLVSFGVFGLAWLWGTKKLLEGAWAIGGIGSSGTISKGSTATAAPRQTRLEVRQQTA